MLPEDPRSDRLPTPPSVRIVILNWNGIEETLRCIGSLERQSYGNFHIVVVDNGSTDDSLRALNVLGGRIRLLSLPRNIGYTGGNNLAMREAFGSGADYVWLFNNDAVATPDALEKLVVACEADPAIGLASPIVLEPNGHSATQSGCGLFDLATPNYIHAHDTNQARDWQRQFADRIVVHGTALLVRRSVYQAIGGLDDSFFAYWEDIDYSIRSAKAGFRNVMVTDAVIHHEHKPTQTAPFSIKPHYYYFMARNELLLWRKFCTQKQFIKAIYWNLLRQLRQIQRMPGNTAGIDAVLGGLWHGYRGIGGGFDPARRMPEPGRELLRRYPTLWLRLLGDKTGRHFA